MSKALEHMLEQLDPLFSEFPTYIVERDPADRDYYLLPMMQDECDVLAWTTRHLDQLLRPYLESRRRWRGNGAAILLNVECHAEKLSSRLFEVVVHEAAHLVDFRFGGLGHDPVWLRALCHLAYRAHGWLASRGKRLDLAKVANLRAYGYPDSLESYRNALRSELGKTSRPLCQILRTPAPAEFRELMAGLVVADVASFGNGLEAGSQFGTVTPQDPRQFWADPQSEKDPLDPIGQLEQLPALERW